MNVHDDDEDDICPLPLPPAGQKVASGVQVDSKPPPAVLQAALCLSSNDEDIPIADLSKYHYNSTAAVKSTPKPRRAVQSVKNGDTPKPARSRVATSAPASTGAQSKKRVKRSPPPPKPKPLDLSELPLPSIRTLQMCPLCSQSFAANKTGPSKLSHIASCAAAKSLPVELVDELVKVEVQRLVDARRREEKNKTLFEQTLAESVVVGREGRKRRDPVLPQQEVKFGRGLDVGPSLTLQPPQKSRTQARKEVDALLFPPPEETEPPRTQEFKPSRLAQRKSLRRENSDLFAGNTEPRPLLDVVRQV